MEEVKIPLLEAGDIKVRAQQVKKNRAGSVGVTLLLYKDSRVDMRLLDEVFGVYGWQCEFNRIGNNLYCELRIKDPETGEWLTKSNVGTPSNNEAEKGEASDALKRAGFMLGIGRELYTAPFIYVTLNDGEYYQRGESYHMTVNFKVSYIHYNDRREIDALQIKDGKGAVRYQWKAVQPQQTKGGRHE